MPSPTNHKSTPRRKLDSALSTDKFLNSPDNSSSLSPEATFAPKLDLSAAEEEKREEGKVSSLRRRLSPPRSNICACNLA